VNLRPELESCVATLLLRAQGTGKLSLSEFAEGLGTLRVDATEIEQMFLRLEQQQIAVDSAPIGSLMPLLTRVLAAARELRAAGKLTTPRAIAGELDVTEAQVRAALLLARTLS
jgi:hypothetical protein